MLQKKNTKKQEVEQLPSLKLKSEIPLKNPLVSFSNSQQLKQLLENYLMDQPIQLVGVVQSLMAWCQINQDNTLQILKEALSTSIRQQSLLKVFSKLQPIQMKMQYQTANQIDVMNQLTEAINEENYAEQTISEITEDILNKFCSNKATFLDKILKDNQHLFRRVMATRINRKYILVDRPIILIKLREIEALTFLDCVADLLTTLKDQTCQDLQISDIESTSIAIAIGLKKPEAQEEFVRYLVESLFQYDDPLKGLIHNYDALIQLIHYSDTKISQYIINALSNICKNKRFLYTALNDVLTNQSHYSMEQANFFTNNILSKLEMEGQFNSIFTQVFTSNHLFTQQSDAQYRMSLDRIFKSKIHKYCDDLLQAVSEQKSQFLLLSDYQYLGLEMKKSQVISGETLKLIVEHAKPRISGINNFYSDFNKVISQDSSKKKFYLTDQTVFITMLKSFKQEHQIYLTLEYLLILINFCKVNVIAVDDIRQQYLKFQLDLSISIDQLKHNNIILIQGDKLTINEQLLIEYYSNKQNLQRDIKIMNYKRLGVEKQQQESLRDDGDLKIITDALIVKILKREKRIGHSQLLDILQRDQNIKNYQGIKDQSKFEDILKSLEKRGLIIIQESELYFNI